MEKIENRQVNKIIIDYGVFCKERSNVIRDQQKDDLPEEVALR